MTKKWNLQDIRPAQPRRPKPSNTPTTDMRSDSYKSELGSDEELPSIVIEDGNKKSRNRLILSVLLFIAIVGIAIGLSAFLSKTELVIYPEFRQPNISAEFIAYPDKRSGSLSYEIMTLETTGESQVKASGQIQVEEQTIGIIEILKTTSGAERLIKNTRFRSPEGLIFRIQESVVVPGAVKDSSGATIPGTIQAEVFAEEAGE